MLGCATVEEIYEQHEEETLEKEEQKKEEKVNVPEKEVRFNNKPALLGVKQDTCNSDYPTAQTQNGSDEKEGFQDYATVITIAKNNGDLFYPATKLIPQTIRKSGNDLILYVQVKNSDEGHVSNFVPCSHIGIQIQEEYIEQVHVHFVR